MQRNVLTSFRAGAAGLALAAAVTAGAAGAEPVVLSTLDGSFSVSGDIVSFDGETFTLMTAVGEISVSASIVTCAGADCPAVAPETTAIAVAGEPTLGLRLLPALVRAFAERTGAEVVTRETGNDRMVLAVTGAAGATGDLEITILPGASSAGIEALFRGEAQLALANRPARPRETRAFEEFGLGDLSGAGQETVVALDGLVLVTHPENPVRAISIEDAGRVFGGAIVNWAELGGADAPIALYLRSDDIGAREVFETLVLLPGGHTVAEGVTTLGSDEAIAEAVLADPNGIGVVGFAHIGRAQALAVGGECGLKTPPTEFTIKTEEYPLTRLLYMYQTNAPLPAGAEAFRDFIGSEAAQRLVAAAGFIDQSVTLESINAQGLRVASAVLANETAEEQPLLREMVAELVGSDRLSTTFRFDTASPRLNARSQAEIGRLAEVLGGERFASKEVLFIGFTDAVGDAASNRDLSRQQAEEVLRQVLEANPALASTVRMNALGYGEISPLGCDDSASGRRVNRRVEVWVRDVAATPPG